METFDQQLFLHLNFDGGSLMDRLMLVASGTRMWLPLYVLILWLVWRRAGWRNTLLFIGLMVLSIALADMVSGIFKHNGLLGGLLPDFEPRLRPMFSPALEGVQITPDSLVALRRAALPGLWTVHVPPEAVGGLYGTVSAHAATIVALAVLSASVIRKRWFTLLMAASVVLICYSRIYLGKHYPLDLVWGAVVGAALGLGALWCYRHLTQKKELR